MSEWSRSLFSARSNLTCAGITLDVVLVTLICPKAVIGGKAAASAGQNALQKWLATVPAAALEANVPGTPMPLMMLHKPLSTAAGNRVGEIERLAAAAGVRWRTRCTMN